MVPFHFLYLIYTVTKNLKTEIDIYSNFYTPCHTTYDFVQLKNACTKKHIWEFRTKIAEWNKFFVAINAMPLINLQIKLHL